MSQNLLITLPDWFSSCVQNKHTQFRTIEEQMSFTCSLARQNITNKTGGPFGAAVFDMQGHLVAAGVNLVEYHKCSVFHAEILAIILAQQKLDRYDISNQGKESFTLVSSCEPCAMCFGAIPWSGIHKLVCGARDMDARAIGFDEGPKLQTWREELKKRNIDVVVDILRPQAKEILNLYVASGGTLYNAGKQ